MPTDYELSVGHRILIRLDAPCDAFDPEPVGAHVEDNFEVQQLRVMVSCEVRDEPGARPQIQIALDLVGDVDIERVEASIVDAFPILAQADVEVEALDGTVHGTLGGMLSERALGYEFDHSSAEQMRARILAELVARGLSGSARVEIQENRVPGGRRVEIWVSVEAEDEAR